MYFLAVRKLAQTKLASTLRWVCYPRIWRAVGQCVPPCLTFYICCFVSYFGRLNPDCQGLCCVLFWGTPAFVIRNVEMKRLRCPSHNVLWRRELPVVRGLSKPSAGSKSEGEQITLACEHFGFSSVKLVLNLWFQELWANKCIFCQWVCSGLWHSQGSRCRPWSLSMECCH